MTEEKQAKTFQLLIGAFTDAASGAAATERLQSAFKSRKAEMPSVAWVTKDADGKLAIKEMNELDSKTGAIAGGVAGGLLGLLGGKKGALLGAGVGALLGGVAAQKLDTGIPDPRLMAIGAALEAATSAAVCIVAGSAEEEARAILKDLGATLESEPFAMDTDFVKQLQSRNYSGALTMMAQQAETTMSGAAATATETAKKAADQAGAMVNQAKKSGGDAAADATENIPVS